MSNYYETLGVHQNATDSEIKKAYKKLALRWHPDKNQNNQKTAQKIFQEIAEAYEVLSDPQKRYQFDRHGANNYLQQNEPTFGEFSDYPEFFSQNVFRDPFETFHDFFQYDYRTNLSPDNWFSPWPSQYQSASGRDHFHFPSSNNVYISKTSTTTSDGNSFQTVVTTYTDGKVNVETFNGQLDSSQR